MAGKALRRIALLLCRVVHFVMFLLNGHIVQTVTLAGRSCCVCFLMVWRPSATRTTAVIHIVRRPSTALLTAAIHPQTNCKAIIKTKECRDNFVVVYFTFKQNEPISGHNSRAVPCPIGVAGPFYVLRPKAV